MSITAAMSKLNKAVEQETGVNLAFVVIDNSKFNSIFKAWYRMQEITLADAVAQVADLLIESSVNCSMPY
jgi:hypothetical protein